MSFMKIKKLRSDSMGIEGTYKNAHHHAAKCLPFIEALEKLSLVFGFDEWRQGNNIHVFKTTDGRLFDIVPYADETGYVGVEFRRRESRSKATPIMALTDVTQISSLLAVIQAMAKPHPENKASQFKYDKE